MGPAYATIVESTDMIPGVAMQGKNYFQLKAYKTGPLTDIGREVCCDDDNANSE
jgi:hypothetical protein